MNFELILTNTLEQLLSFVGIVYLVGFIISILNRAFYSLVGNTRATVYATGFIGTPIHEISHALMCILFGHRIVEMKLFQIDSDDGTLGYVKHTSNPRNIYQQAGNYFIGVAPIFVTSVILYFAMMKFMPETYREIDLIFGRLSASSADSFGWFSEFGDIFASVMGSMLKNSFASVTGFVFFILSMCIALHMNLSPADIKGSLVAVPLIAVILAVVNAVLYCIPGTLYNEFLGLMNSAGIFVALMLSLALILSVLCVLAAFLVRVVARIIKR